VHVTVLLVFEVVHHSSFFKDASPRLIERPTEFGGQFNAWAISVVDQPQ